MAALRFLYQYPDRHGSDGHFLDAGDVGVIAEAVEAAGFDGFGLTEHPAPGVRWLDAGGHQTLDPFVALGFAAARTSRLRPLTYLSVLPYRNPLLVAKAAATLDLLSHGRFVLGVGTGYLQGEFRALGVDFDERNDLFDEAMEVIRLHWSGETFSYRGRHFEARDIRALPCPGHIPIWIGGNAAVTLRRVAARAEGWMPLLATPEVAATSRTPCLTLDDLAEKVAAVRSATLPRRVDVLAPYIDGSIAAPAVEADRHREAFAALERSGVTWVLIRGTTSAEADTLGFLAEFGATYLAG